MTAYLYNPLWKSLRDAVVNAINIAGGNVSQGSYTANASGVIAALQQLITQIQALNTASTNAQTTANSAQTTANSAQTNLNSHISALGGVHGLSAMFSPLGTAGAGRVVQFGSASPNGALGGPYTIAYFRDVSVTFPTAYSLVPRVAVSSAIPASAWQVTTTGFTLRMWGDSGLASAAFPVDWIAVGAA